MTMNQGFPPAPLPPPPYAPYPPGPPQDKYRLHWVAVLPVALAAYVIYTTQAGGATDPAFGMAYCSG